MKTVAEIISDQLSIQTSSGIRRFRYEPYDMDIALNVVSRIGRGIDNNFEIESVKDFYIELIKYFHGDDTFKGDLTKGILIQGPCGTGKTLAMRIMKIYQTIDNIRFALNGHIYCMNYDVVNVNDIINGFMVNAYDGIQIYCNRYVVCLDDIGTESEEVKYYGNNLDVISHVISERYLKRLLTFATTNFSMDAIEDKYSDRISSRMYAMFNFLLLKNRDFRKPKDK